MKKIFIAFISLFFINVAFAKTFNAGPIWDQSDAQVKCPAVCISHDKNWTGQWSTKITGRMSVCECSNAAPIVVSPQRPIIRQRPVMPRRPVVCTTNDVDAGPIMNNDDANDRCPTVCAQLRSRWNGQWTTTQGTSVCGCTSCQ